jgi:hypothetical protein
MKENIFKLIIKYQKIYFLKIKKIKNLFPFYNALNKNISLSNILFLDENF